jgi:hypothetical protein
MPIEIYGAEDKYKCNICKNIFYSKIGLMNHICRDDGK